MVEGRRIFANEKGELPLAEGDYGFHPVSGWQVRPPGQHAGGIPNHTVIEHEDKTISVAPSIVLYDSNKNGEIVVWHGFLERGMWRVV